MMGYADQDQRVTGIHMRAWAKSGWKKYRGDKFY